MFQMKAQNPFVVTMFTVLVGACGAAVAYALGLPAWVLLGPAVLVSCVAAAGTRMKIADPLRDICFIILGLGIGSGFDPDASDALLRWPVAFAVLPVMLVATMSLSRFALVRGFGFDRRSASLAAAPGHLSYVTALATESNVDVVRVTVVQAIRLLCLTVSVPFIARGIGYEFDTMVMSDAPAMHTPVLAGLALLSCGVAFVFQRLRFPAPVLLAAMVVSSVGHATDVTPGSVPQYLMTPALMVLGTLIGTRFAGLSRDVLRSSLLAGLCMTFISVSIATVAALPVARVLGIPLVHVLTAFAPGGLETMVALGAVIGASPGFVAACHVTRLLILVVLIPLYLGRRPNV